MKTLHQSQQKDNPATIGGFFDATLQPFTFKLPGSGREIHFMGKVFVPDNSSDSIPYFVQWAKGKG